MFGNPAYGDLRYDPTRFSPPLAPVNSPAPPQAFTAQPLPPSSWQPPPRYYAGAPSPTPQPVPVSKGPVPVNRSPTVNTAYTPGSSYRPSLRPVNPTATPVPSVSSPVASPVALKGLPSAGQFKPPQIPGGPGAALGAAAMLPMLANALGNAAGDLGNLAEAAYEAGRNPGRGNLAVALTLFPLAPFALAGLAERRGRPEYIPDWLWPFPDPPAPNTLDPAAMDSGPIITEGTPPPFKGGQSSGVAYSVTYQYNTVLVNGAIQEPPIVQTIGGPWLVGPIRGIEVRGVAGSLSLHLLYGNGQESFLSSSSAPQGDFRNVKIGSVGRIDGQPDTGGDPPGGTAPVRALNPARQTSTPTAPRTLPPPTAAPAETDLPWPETAAEPIPDTTPLEPATSPPNFSPTATPDPLPPTAPEPNPQPTNLDKPAPTPSNLADNPLTPPVKDPLDPVDKAAPTAGPKSALSALNNPFAPLAVVIPIILIDGLRQKVNTPSASLIDKSQPNKNIQVVKPPSVPVANVPNPPTCIYERQRIADIQAKATDVQQKASNPVSGFPGLYGIGIESRVKLGQTFDLLGTVDQFARKAWEKTQLQKVINALTLVTVLHNATMISRDVGETLGYALGEGLDVLGIEDEKGQTIDVNNWFGKTATKFFEGIFGVERWRGLNATWNKANRIISSASNIVYTIRSISDGVKEVTEMAAENTGKIGNALKRSGLVTERSYPWMAEKVRAQDAWSRKTARVMDGLESAENVAGSFAQVTSNVKEIQEEVGELEEQTTAFKALVGTPPETPKVATPDENAAIVTAGDEGATNAKSGPAVAATDMEPGTNGTP